MRTHRRAVHLLWRYRGDDGPEPEVMEGELVQDPRGLFDLESARTDFGGPVLIYSLAGFVDAGGAGRLLADHLVETLEHEVVATFDVDQLLDFRGRRPAMTFSKDHWSQYSDPSLILYALHDQAGQEFLLLQGPEPDFQWERFAEAVRLLVERLGVRLAVTFHGIPMAVPHTRPLGVTAHATDPTIIAGNEAWMGEVLVPGSASALLEFRLGEWGHPAAGYAVHVPHYLSQADFHDAALVALRAVSALTGLSLPDAALEDAAESTRADIIREVGDSEDVGRVVAALEQQYDTFLEGRTRGSLLASEAGELPSADELGAAFEQFLAEQTDEGPPR
jgi:predicted ATP-grasp superfamily ATP-dependent carboligase